MDEELYHKYFLNLLLNNGGEIPSNLTAKQFLICRICMRNEESMKLQRIPSAEWQNDEIIKKFENITRIQFLVSDESPDLICEQCIDWIHETSKKLQMFHEIDQFWNLYISKSQHTSEATIKSENVANSEMNHFPFTSDKKIKLEPTDSKCFIQQLTKDDGNEEATTGMENNGNETDGQSENNSIFEFINVLEPPTGKQTEKINKVKKIKTKKLKKKRKVKKKNSPPKKDPKETIIKLSKKICPYCKEEFVSKLACVNHAREVHDPSFDRDGESICYYCDFSFPLKSTLVEHMDLIHRGYDKKHIFCKICKRTFANFHRYRLHIRLSHLSNITFECYLCKRVCLQQKYLKEHMQNHISIPKFMCDSCGLVLKAMKSLKRHKVTAHQKSGPTKGNIKRSLSKSKLICPPDQRQWLCTLCDRKLGTMLSLKWHMTTKHPSIGPKEFKTLSKTWCIKCSLTLSSIEEFEQHLSQIHPPKPKQKPMRYS